MSTNRKPINFLAFANDRADDARYLRNLSREARRLQKILDQVRREDLCE